MSRPQQDSGNEIALCPGCGAMKHLNDISGFCGRCTVDANPNPEVSEPCKTCVGTGYWNKSYMHPTEGWQNETECVICHGTGKDPLPTNTSEHHRTGISLCSCGFQFSVLPEYEAHLEALPNHHGSGSDTE